MRETKVNLKHLLEDIRDSYTVPVEEIILLELIANALDSGANRISFFTEPSKNIFTLIDNGKGMDRRSLPKYHNIASSTKVRGKGIGFAGIGAKLSLLVGERVYTETKGGRGSRAATEWYLKNETSAPWKFIPFSGKVPYPRGSAVSIKFKNANFPLLWEDFIVKKTYMHFYPLFHPELFTLILKSVYKKGVEFYLNNKKISFKEEKVKKTFQIRLGGRGRRLIGTGFLTKTDSFENILFRGIAVSTYGKIIKSGWEWIGVSPKEDGLFGVVEIPALSEILTTNKMDFLRDGKSLKKYYQYRKAIQSAIIPLLNEFGEKLEEENLKKSYRSLSKEIERSLRNVLKGFPELTPLLGIKRTKGKSGVVTKIPQSQIVDIVKENNSEKKKDSKKKNSSLSESKKGLPSLTIGFEKRGAIDPIARMMENRIWINNSHPAYLKAKEERLDNYHIVFSTALTLSSFLEDSHSPEKFINDFLSAWGKDKKKTNTLFKVSHNS